MNNSNYHIDEIEQELITKLDDIYNGIRSNLYHFDKFKTKQSDIDIITPAVTTPYTAKKLFPDSDYLKNKLSLYPDKRELQLLERILVIPKYIAQESLELVAIYSRARQTLALYPSLPHLYSIDNLNDNIQRLIIRELSTTPPKQQSVKTEIDPLWYIISTVNDNLVPDSNCLDKFFVNNTPEDKNMQAILHEMTEYYTKTGY